MKKLISLFISLLLVVSALPVMAADTDVTTTNVALNRPGFAYWAAATTPCEWATDGDLTTAYLSAYSGRFHIDLGSAYTIKDIKLNLVSEYDVKYRVYLSNYNLDTYASIHGGKTFPVSDATIKIYEVGDTAATVDDNGYSTIDIASLDSSVLTDAQKTAKYRFVCIEHDARFSINEMEVNTTDEDTGYYWVEVGAYKPAFATSSYGTTYPAWQANDRNYNTSWLSDTDVTWTQAENSGSDSAVAVKKALTQRLVIDLEQAMPIKAITFRTLAHAGISGSQPIGGVSVYATNDLSLSYSSSGVNKIWSNGNTLNASLTYFKVPADKETAYRYVVLEGVARPYPTYASTSDNYYNLLGTTDILIYSDTTTGITRPNMDRNYRNQVDDSDKSKRVHKISSSMATVTGGANMTTVYPENLLDGKLTTTSLMGGVNNFRYVYIDLGKPQEIDYVTMLRDSSQSVTYSNKGNIVFVTNYLIDKAAQRYDASRGDVIMTTIPAEGLTPGAMHVYEASAGMEGNKYRYVVLGIADSDGLTTDTCWTADQVTNAPSVIRMSLAMLDVYTKNNSLDEVHTAVTFAQTDNDTYTASSTKFLSATGRSYSFIAAAYNDSYEMIDCAVVPVDLGYGVDSVLSATADIADITGATKVKVMLWDMEDNQRPIVASQEFAITQ